MVITYEDASKAVRALYALREAKYEDKHLLGKTFFIIASFLLFLSSLPHKILIYNPLTRRECTIELRSLICTILCIKFILFLYIFMIICAKTSSPS